MKVPVQRLFDEDSVLTDYIPPFLSRNLFDLVAYIKFFLYPQKESLRKNCELQNYGKNKKAFVLATGPSLKLENLKLLQGQDCFSVSNFFLHDDISIVQPKFHFFVPYNDNESFSLETYVNWLQQADKHLPESTKIVLGHSTKNLVKDYSLFPNREVFYLYVASLRNQKLRNIDLTGLLPFPRTGPLMILPVLIYMGYSEIYLLGCDATWLRDCGKNSVQNFYSADKDIRKNIIPNKLNVTIQASNLCRVIDLFRKYGEFMDRKKQGKIINLSKDTWIDIFPKSDLEKVLGSLTSEK
jgi:hypothetical protein